jgi:hypothetical protein
MDQWTDGKIENGGQCRTNIAALGSKGDGPDIVASGIWNLIAI